MGSRVPDGDRSTYPRGNPVPPALAPPDWEAYARSRSSSRLRWLGLHHRMVTAAFVDFVRNLPLGLRVLDGGCSDGFFLGILRDLGFTNTIGLDISEVRVKACRDKGLDARCLPLEQCADLGAFDLVLLMDVLEHVPDPAVTLRAVHQALTPGGALYLNVPVCDSFRLRLDRVLKRRTRLQQSVAWDETHRHAWSARELNKIVGEAGFALIRGSHYSNRPLFPRRLSGSIADFLQGITLGGRFGDLYSAAYRTCR
jgi:SAM-dependent methyltransferase